LIAGNHGYKLKEYFLDSLLNHLKPDTKRMPKTIMNSPTVTIRRKNQQIFGTNIVSISLDLPSPSNNQAQNAYLQDNKVSGMHVLA